MTIVIALLGFNDLGRSVTLIFLFRNRFYLQLSPHYPIMNKKAMWEVKKKFKISFFGIWHHFSTSRALDAWRGMWIGAAALRSKDAQKQLVRTSLNHIWQRTFPFKALIAIFGDLQPLRPSSLTKPDVLPGMFSPKRSRWPRFFYISDITISSSFHGKFSEK